MVATKYPWAKPLQIPEQHLALWQSEISRHGSVLVWCIENKKVNENIYLSWARNFYELPSIDPEFFENPPNKNFFEQIESVGVWSQTMIPIGQWDGVVFVACLEPQKDVKWSFPVQFLLAPLSGLKGYWDSLKGQKEQTVSQAGIPNDLPPTPVAARTAITETDHSAADFDGFSLDEDQSPTKKNRGAKANENLFELADEPQAESNSAVEIVAEEENEAPSGFDLEEHSKSDAKRTPHAEDTPEGMDFGGTAEEPSGLQIDAPEMTSSSIMIGALSKDSPVKKETLRKSAPPKVAAVEEEESVFEMESTPVPQNKVVAKTKLPMANVTEHTPTPPMRPQGRAIGISSAPNAFSVARDENEAMAYVFAQLRAGYQSALVLKRHGSLFRAVAWLDNLKVEEVPTPVDPNLVSLFRIVVKTRHPYHGHVVQNQVNDLFFKELGLKANPAHVTAVPITQGKEVVGILMAFGDAKSSTTSNLNLTMKSAEQLASRMASDDAEAA